MKKFLTKKVEKQIPTPEIDNSVKTKIQNPELMAKKISAKILNARNETIRKCMSFDLSQSKIRNLVDAKEYEEIEEI